MKAKILIYLLLPFIILKVTAQETTFSCNFDQEDTPDWKVATGKAEVMTKGAWQGKSLCLHPQTTIYIPLLLQPASSYELTAFVRTESGADHIALQITGLGKNNISLSSALASWTKQEHAFNVSNKQQEAVLEILFESNAGDTYAWVDDIIIRRTGNYHEKTYDGIPPAPIREVKTDMGITMQSDEKIQWMLDGKLGLFIHWGLYAGPGKGEWYMENQGIPIEEYRKLAYPESGEEYFDAKDFDARRWISLAKRVGMKYVCLTTQHHDGYALFESQYMNAFTSKQTHNRDFVKEYVEACREAGLKVGFYKTLINWRFPGYYDITGTNCRPDNRFGYTTDISHKENARLMKEELYCQVKELMTRYGKIDHLFWDGGWIAQQGSDADGAPFWESGKYMNADNEWPVNPYFCDYDQITGKPLGLMGIVRKYQPDIVVNPRCGWIGDFTCEEGGGSVKGEIRSGVVEKCVSLAPGWGYNKQMENPDRIMPLKKVKRLFADCLVRNMCFLLNVGPDRHGNIAPLVEQRLLEFGDWVNTTSEAVYGTRGGPWQPVDGQYGFCYRNNVIYIYFLGGYMDNNFTLPPLNKGMKVRQAYNVVTKERIQTKQKKQSVTLSGIHAVKDDLTVIAVILNQPVQSENNHHGPLKKLK